MTPRIVVDLTDASLIRKFQGERVVDEGGYILVWNETEGRYFSEHRVVVEEVLGRHLLTEEQVHHINGVRHDNRKGNLIVCSPEYHTYLDSLMRLKRRPWISWYWEGIYSYLHWGRKLSSSQRKILKKIAAYTSRPFTVKGIPKLDGSLPRVRMSGKSE